MWDYLVRSYDKAFAYSETREAAVEACLADPRRPEACASVSNLYVDSFAATFPRAFAVIYAVGDAQHEASRRAIDDMRE